MIKTISADEYHASQGLSASLAKILLSKSPLHAWMESPMNPARVQSESSRLDIGTAAHAALLEGLDVVQVCDYDDWRTKAAKEEREAARLDGRIPLLPDQYATIKAMVKVANGALEDCPDLHGVKWSDGNPEQSIFWTNGDAECRARLDWLANDHSLIIDYKTTELSPDAWMRAIPKNGYDIQAAHYLDAVEHESGKKADFVFMVQETEYPYMVYFVGLPAAYLEIGAAKMKISRERWTECLNRSEWPGYPKGIQYADIPAWTLAEVEEKLITQETWNELAFRFGKVKPKERSK